MDEKQLVLVDKKVLPEIFLKVLMAKSFLSKDIAKNSTDACKLAELSRSAFYKYKESVFFYEEKDNGSLVTYYLKLSDETGVLARVLQKISGFNGNIITVNQNIPVDRVAVVTISFRTEINGTNTIDLLQEVSRIYGVVSVKQI